MSRNFSPFQHRDRGLVSPEVWCRVQNVLAAHQVTIDTEPDTAFDIFLDPGVHAHALATDSETASSTADGAGDHTSQVACLNVEPTVELTGLEPATYSLRTSRATSCATAPRAPSG